MSDAMRPTDAGQGSDASRPTELSCDDVRELAGGFVLGALDPAEDAAVRAHLGSCPELHEEIAELGSVLPILQASVAQVEPSTGLKARLMAAAAADLEARGRSVGSAPATDSSPASMSASAPVDAPASTSVSASATVPVSAPVSAPAPTPDATGTRSNAVTTFPTPAERQARVARRAGLGGWALRIAAVLAIGVLGAWNVLLQGQLDASRTYETNVAAVLDLAREAGSATAVLTPIDGNGPAGVAAVGADGTMAVAMRDLAPTAGTEVYEVWMIGGDGVPVALGGFTVGSTGIGYFEGAGVPASAGIVLALTREPAPGATAPSSDPVSLGTTLSS